jgi:hypothetical protein
VGNTILTTCEDPKSDSGWITISSIYQGMRSDPLGLTNEQLIRACYQAHNVPDGLGLSDDQFSQLIDSDSYVPSTPDALVCYWDPDGSQHMTLEQAQQWQANKEGPKIVIGPDGSTQTVMPSK